MGKGAMDEFAFVLLAGLIFIGILMLAWTTPLELPPKVSPSSIEIEATPGSAEIFSLNISRKLTDVELSASGDIANWVKFTKNNFDVSKFILVDVKLSVPKDAQIRTYKGGIKVSSQGGTETIPVTVVVQKEVVRALESRNIPFGDFFVGFTSGEKDLDLRQNVEVQKGYFSERPVNLVGSLTDREMTILKGGSIKLVVEDSNKLGNLVVMLNDVEVLDKKAGPGEVVIPIDKKMIKQTNVVNIKADGPGLVFWASTLYQLRSAKVAVDLEGAFAKELAFKLRPIETSTFDGVKIAYKAEDFSSSLPYMTIKLNDQIIYQAKPSTTSFDEKFETDIFGEPLIVDEEDNKILFSFEEEASYSVSNAVLTVFYKGI